MKNGAVSLALFLVASVTASAQVNRPANWAQPVIVAGVTNCYQVTSNLYRGAQPSAEGFRRLEAMGIKTVVSLRSFHSDTGKIAGTGLKDIRFEVKPWHGEEEDVVGFLKVMADTNNFPVFVHCLRGADRTGMMCAMYRVVDCGWTKEQAIDEMKHGGFDFSPAWENLVRFVEKTDVEELKRRVTEK